MTRLVGNYTIGELLGRGGMSEVYAGEHRFLGDRVAIKLLHTGAETAPQTTEAFLAEAARTRSIEHPNVVRVIDFGRDDDSHSWYLVMERIEGRDLAKHLEASGALPEARVRALGAAIADGLQAAHQAGIVHRDLKPANVMLCGDQPKIIDFGIAKHLGDSVAALTGRRIGTPAYMAPEQMTGGLVTPGTDVWALGVVLFELAAGSLPFSGFDDGRCPQLLEPAPSLASRVSVSTALSDIVAQCLERDPTRRFRSMAELARALRGDPVEVRGPSPDSERMTEELPPPGSRPVEPAELAPEPPARTQQPRALSLWVPGAAAAIAAVAVGLWMARSDSPSGSGERPRIAMAPPDAAQAIRSADAAPARPIVRILSDPPGAHVLRDGALIAITPARLALTLPVTLSLSKPGYRRTRFEVTTPGPQQIRLRKLARSRSKPRPRRKHRPKGETLD